MDSRDPKLAYLPYFYPEKQSNKKGIANVSNQVAQNFSGRDTFKKIDLPDHPKLAAYLTTSSDAQTIALIEKDNPQKKVIVVSTYAASGQRNRNVLTPKQYEQYGYERYHFSFLKKTAEDISLENMKKCISLLLTIAKTRENVVLVIDCPAFKEPKGAMIMAIFQVMLTYKADSKKPIDDLVKEIYTSIQSTGWSIDSTKQTVKDKYWNNFIFKPSQEKKPNFPEIRFALSACRNLIEYNPPVYNPILTTMAFFSYNTFHFYDALTQSIPFQELLIYWGKNPASVESTCIKEFLDSIYADIINSGAPEAPEWITKMKSAISLFNNFNLSQEDKIKKFKEISPELDGFAGLVSAKTFPSNFELKNIINRLLNSINNYKEHGVFKHQMHGYEPLAAYHPSEFSKLEKKLNESTEFESTRHVLRLLMIEMHALPSYEKSFEHLNTMKTADWILNLILVSKIYKCSLEKNAEQKYNFDVLKDWMERCGYPFGTFFSELWKKEGVHSVKLALLNYTHETILLRLKTGKYYAHLHEETETKQFDESLDALLKKLADGDQEETLPPTSTAARTSKAAMSLFASAPPPDYVPPPPQLPSTVAPPQTTAVPPAPPPPKI